MFEQFFEILRDTESPVHVRLKVLSILAGLRSVLARMLEIIEE